jgi:hypothetical protein
VKRIHWVEPMGPESEPIHCWISEAAAIRISKAVAKLKGHIYESDQQALGDFMAVHWATTEEQLLNKVFHVTGWIQYKEDHATQIDYVQIAESPEDAIEMASSQFGPKNFTSVLHAEEIEK